MTMRRMMSFNPRPLEQLDLQWPPELDHFSASSAKMAVRCPEQWRRRYVQGEKIPPSLNMIAGKADHAAIELSMAQKIDSFVDLPVGEVQQAYLEKVEAEVDWSGGLQELEWKTDLDSQAARVREYDKVRVDGQDLVAAYHRVASPTLQPLAVEKQFEVDVPGVPVKMVGYIDLIAQDENGSIFLNEMGVPGFNKRLIDRKRRNRNTTKIEPEWSIQAEVYQYVEPLPFEFHLSVTTKTPQIVYAHPDLTLPVVSRDRTERLVQQIVGSIGFCYMKYGPDEPWPAQGRLHPWACNYCGFRAECWAWKS